MGWDLKITPPRKSFSQRQRDYLLAQFRVGESSGKKENAALVAKTIVRAEDVDGDRSFHADEFFTSKQILSFFSRPAAKKKLEQTATPMMSMRQNYLMMKLEVWSMKNHPNVN